MLLVIDNYDSFTYNLVQYLGELGAEPVVKRNDELTVEEVGAHGAARDRPLARARDTRRRRGSPSPVVRRWSGTIPILGVCLGHQAIGEAFGGRVVRADAGDARQDLARRARWARSSSPGSRRRSR